MKTPVHTAALIWTAALIGALSLPMWSAGCADAKGTNVQSATVDGNRYDAGDDDAGAEPVSDECPRSDDPVLETEPNDRASEAQLVVPCVVYTIRGTPDGADADQEWFKVRVPDSATSLSVTITALRGSGPELWLLRTQDQPIEHRALPADETLTITTGVSGGEYLIRARTGAGSEYALFIELPDARYELEEANDQAATAPTIAFDTTYTAQDSALGAGTELDWFRLEVPEGSRNLTVEIEDIGEDDTIETELWLVRVDAAPIEHRVLRGGEALAVTTGVSAGEYFVRVDPGEKRTYTLRAVLGAAPFELEECNDVADTAQLVELGATYAGRDSAPATEPDWDWFRIAMPAGAASMTVRLDDIGGGAESGTALWLYRPATELIEHRILDVGERLDLQTGVVEGEYFLKILVGAARAYTLTVAASDTPFELEESNDRRETAALIEPGVTYTGQGSALATEAEDEDWYRVLPPAGASSMMVTLTDLSRETSATTDLVVFDESEIQIGYLAPDAGGTASSSVRIGAGEHAFVVRSERGHRYRVVATF